MLSNIYFQKKLDNIFSQSWANIFIKKVDPTLIPKMLSQYLFRKNKSNIFLNKVALCFSKLIQYFKLFQYFTKNLLLQLWLGFSWRRSHGSHSLAQTLKNLMSLPSRIWIVFLPSRGKDRYVFCHFSQVDQSGHTGLLWEGPSNKTLFYLTRPSSVVKRSTNRHALEMMDNKLG
jgi:hypothetical protein